MLSLIIALAVTVPGPASVRPGPAARGAAAIASVQVDGSRRFQTIDGFGVNAIPKSWEGGALRPAIDLLVAMGATIWRVDVGNGHSTWEATNDDADPFHFNWAAYNAIYSSPAFEDLWSELAYLNSKGVTIELSLSGKVPAWMGDATVASGMEDEFVEEVVSLAYYARNTRGISFHLLSPVNETDIGAPEGVLEYPPQLLDLFHRVAARLDAVGMSDVEIVGPETTGYNADYTYQMLSDPLVMAHVRRFAYHNYSGCCASTVTGIIAASAYPDRHVWLGEWSQSRTDGWLDNGQPVQDEWVFAREMTSDLLNHLADGVHAALAWDAWDNWHEHQACCPVSHWGQVAKDASGTYRPKKRYFSNEQVFRFVSPGMTRIGTTSADPNLRLVAFSGPGGITLVGRNAGNAALTVSGTLTGTPTVTSLALYRTSATEDLVRGPDVAVSGGTFNVDIPADSFFTLTSRASSAATGPDGDRAAAADAESDPAAAPGYVRAVGRSWHSGARERARRHPRIACRVVRPVGLPDAMRRAIVDGDRRLLQLGFDRLGARPDGRGRVPRDVGTGARTRSTEPARR
jgi:O-glycosyl hydrolase